MKKALVAAAAAVTIAVLGAGKAGAILYGQHDEDHSGVGYIVFYEGNTPLWRCSGSLVSRTVMLTAAHCAGTFVNSSGVHTPTRAQVWFDSQRMATGNYSGTGSCDGFTGFPCTGGESYGRPVAHPGWEFVDQWVNDIGVVVLDRRMRDRDVMKLAKEGRLDKLARSKKGRNGTFTIVGFGTQSVEPPPVDQRERMSGNVKFLGIEEDPTFADFTNDRANGAAACLGDSGGPVLDRRGRIVAVISGSDMTLSYCEGVGFHFRTDTADALAFLARFGVGASGGDDDDTRDDGDDGGDGKRRSSEHENRGDLNGRN